MKSYKTLISFLIFHFGCETTGTPPVRLAAVSAPIEHVQTCEYESESCLGRTSPTVCEIPEYIFSKGQFLSRGPNPCEARKEMMAKLCAGGIQLLEKNLINCAPDPTMSECWDLKNSTCQNDSDDVKTPHSCIITRYNGKELPKSFVLRSFGSTLCEARRKLLDLSCELRLKPSGIDTTSCEPTSLSTICPPPTLKCPRLLQPTECSTQIADEQRATVIGDNECIAKHKLLIKLCHMHVNLDKIKQIKCKSVN